MLAPAASITVDPGLRMRGFPQRPNRAYADRSTAIGVDGDPTSTQITFKNNGAIQDSAVFLVRYEHTIEDDRPDFFYRGLGASAGGGGDEDTEDFFFVPGVAVGDAVYLSSANTVDKSDAVSQATMPVIGFVKSIAFFIATVKYSGPLGGYVGLTSGKVYFARAGTPGAIVKLGDPGFPANSGEVLQRLGYAKNTTTLHIEVDQDLVVL